MLATTSVEIPWLLYGEAQTNVQDKECFPPQIKKLGDLGTIQQYP